MTDIHTIAVTHRSELPSIGGMRRYALTYATSYKRVVDAPQLAKQDLSASQIGTLRFKRRLAKSRHRPAGSNWGGEGEAPISTDHRAPHQHALALIGMEGLPKMRGTLLTLHGYEVGHPHPIIATCSGPADSCLGTVRMSRALWLGTGVKERMACAKCAGHLKALERARKAVPPALESLPRVSGSYELIGWAEGRAASGARRVEARCTDLCGGSVHTFTISHWRCQKATRCMSCASSRSAMKRAPRAIERGRVAVSA